MNWVWKKVRLRGTLFFYSEKKMQCSDKGIPFSRNPGKFPGSRKPRDYRDSGNSRENFPGNFPELDHFDIFYDFQHFRSFNMLLCCFDKLRTSF